jgi:ammonia channel protein AmtB
MKLKLLIIAAIIVVTIFWFTPFQLNMSDEVIFTGISIPRFGVDGFTMSASIVTLIVLLFSVMSWTLLSWADHRKSILHNIPASALLGLIVIIPISGMVGLMFAVILGVIIGSCLFGFEFWRKRK